MVPLMIETIAKKLQDSALLPAAIVKSQVFGKQFHTICSGGAYLDPSYIDLFQKYGITILQGYGMTECAPVISTTVSWNIRKDSVGQLIPNCRAKTVDGELWVKGSSVMQGYYKMPEETAETLADGWLKTGGPGLCGRGWICVSYRTEEESDHHQERGECFPGGAGKPPEPEPRW